MIKISNTINCGIKQVFQPIDSNRVTLYVCGITPYDYAHSGHGRCYVTFDMLYRLLKFFYPIVIYTRNFTNIDDKLIFKAQNELADKFKFGEIAQKYINAFGDNMKDLNCLKPDFEPKVTDFICDIVEFVKKLIDKKHAYNVDGNVYFDVNSFQEYGKLSKRNLKDMIAGARVELNENKKNSVDFALWKKEEDNTFYKSPWGFGRPGWHIECSVMASKILGQNIDIHAGGMDLIFPHHENEIAQSESLFQTTFANYWVHNAFVCINKEKMSKSLGNFFTLNDIFKKFDPMIFRFYLLTHHYRSPLEFSFYDMEISKKNYIKIINYFMDVEDVKIFDEQVLNISPIAKKMFEFLCDDLNSVGAIGLLFENLSTMKEESKYIKYILKNFMGLTLNKFPEEILSDDIIQLIKERDLARLNKDWKRSDEIRDQLLNLKIILKDSKL